MIKIVRTSGKVERFEDAKYQKIIENIVKAVEERKGTPFAGFLASTIDKVYIDDALVIDRAEIEGEQI